VLASPYTVRLTDSSQLKWLRGFPNWVYWKIFIFSDEKVHCVNWFYIIISKKRRRLRRRLYQNLSRFIHIGCVFTEMKCTKQSVIGVHHRKWNIQNEVPSGVFFSVHSPEMKCTKPSYSCSHLRRNTLEKNPIYSHTRTLIGPKNFPNLRLTDKTFFSG
jgi:hypothetical protein